MYILTFMEGNNFPLVSFFQLNQLKQIVLVNVCKGVVSNFIISGFSGKTELQVYTIKYRDIHGSNGSTKMNQQK